MTWKLERTSRNYKYDSRNKNSEWRMEVKANKIPQKVKPRKGDDELDKVKN